jgi:spore coat polysaccharide biosynthesis predicted glycosyltransferase SpsG
MKAALVADAGPEAGLGHLSRTGAVAVALRSGGVEVRCLAWGAGETINRDGLEWEPLAPAESPPADGVVVLDSYAVSGDAVRELAAGARLVLMHDRDAVPDAEIVTSTIGREDAAGRLRLFGLSYACLRPSYWGLPDRQPGDSVRRVLIATGGGDSAGTAAQLAESVREALPGAEVAVLRGPYATGELPDGIVAVEHPPTLLGELLGADLIVTAGGQTLLEAAATGTPAIAVVLAEDQRTQAEAVASAGAAMLAEPGPGVSEAAGELAASVGTRAALARRGQELIDGYGALRVGFHVGRLIERADGR